MRSHRKALAACDRVLAARGAAKDTRRVVASAARQFLAHAGKPLARLVREDVRDFLAELRARGVAPITVKLGLLRVRAFCRALVEAGLLAEDPTEGVPVPAASTPPQLLLSTDEVRRLVVAALEERTGLLAPREIVKALAVRDRACVELLYGVGLRRSEAGAARVQDLDLAQGELLVRRAKRHDWTTLPLVRATLEPLRRYVTEARPVLAQEWRGTAGDHLLLARSGGPLEGAGVFQVVKSVARRAGVVARPHAFRRAVATHLVQDGVSVEAVRQLLGHLDLDTTARYTALGREDLRRAVLALEVPLEEEPADPRARGGETATLGGREEAP